MALLIPSLVTGGSQISVLSEALGMHFLGPVAGSVTLTPVSFLNFSTFPSVE